MDREKQVSLLSECLAHIKDKEPYMGAEEALIPVSQYTDEVVFQKERQRLFLPSMHIVGLGQEIATPGEFITRDVFGTPTLLVRDQSGTVRAFVNVCRHRGATLERREKGKCKRFVCPYHAWTYKTDGSLATVRHQEGFPSLDVENTSLMALSCVEAAGFLWVCPDPQQKDLALDAHLLELASELEALGCAQGVPFARTTKIWNANWKLLVDGGLESYHFRVAHSATIAPFFADNVSTYECFGDHIRSILPRLSLLELEGKPKAEWDIREHSHLLYSLYPSTSILVQERHVELILMTPLSVDQTKVELITIAKQPETGGFSEKAQTYLNANHHFTKTTLDEDFALGEEIQKGLHTGANEFFRFARFEGALTQWHKLIDAKMAT